MGQVLAHVLACDADLIELLGAVGRPGPAPPSGPRRGEHEQEAARWSSAECDALAGELRQRSERWRALLEGLEDAAFAMPARIWWRTEAAPLLEVAADWRGHDSQHAEDVRLAVEARGARVRE